MTDHMTYEAARDLIKDGDPVLIWRPKGWHGFPTFFHYTMNFLTGSPVYHTTIALWMTSPTGVKRLMVCEQNMLGGKRIVPLSIYHLTPYYHKMEVWHVPTDMYAKMETEVMRDETAVYGFWNLVVIGLNEFFGIRLKETKSQVCSELTSACLIAGGAPISETLNSPGKLRSKLVELYGEPSIAIDVV